ncbi:restriction endonuclease subunit R [Candidatus Woesebacteria bacterium RBG_16_34_12]|uniref:Restriction endonuclease subunit R n=1 Tax=Candidatus Woesebacteria bacterium RBG_16_34_12 TaxID=1802480 RepID=A0A1F7XC35_9BACT|nr:MAG: restriction endonuclease subunit R [Candidatus Woesebacteria bacterium RBG_16_34_12]
MDNISEWTTRKKIIDGRLKAAGWTTIVPYSDKLDLTKLHNAAVEELPTENGPADYVLFLYGQPVAIVEAKKLSLGPQNVLIQAQRYAKGLNQGIGDFNGYKVPFIYSTNGEVIWFQDLRPDNSRSRKVKAFHTPQGLSEMAIADLASKTWWFNQNPIDNEKLRYYQKEAISSIESAIQNNKRAMLVAMATGTGKTYTIASLIYRLLKSGTSKRILFLVDRKALAAQAVMEFAAYEAESGLKFNQIYQVYSQKFQSNYLEDDDKFDFTALPNSYLTNPDGNQVFVYVCTIQRMRINLFGNEGMFSDSGEYDPEDDADKLDIPIHAFDTIIADECHRGYTSQEVSKWREVLDHFDATKIGLTATPAAHTTSYFKEIVYRYPYEKAVKDGFLVDYDAVKIESGIRLRGITIQAGEEVEEIDPSTGVQQLDLLEDEKHYETTELEREVTSPDSNRKIIQEYANFALEQEKELGRFPKTLIFADNDLPHTSHSDQIVDVCRDVFGRGDAFVQKITGSPTVDRPLRRIKEFRNRPEPLIVVTVDMLSTGVDIPAIENIVFLRPVRSRILFEQMMGRGTRLCKSFPNGIGTAPKTHFTVFDCFAGTLLESFKNETSITQSTPLSPNRTIRQIIQELSDSVDVDYNTRCLVKRLQRINKNITQEGRDRLTKFIPDGDLGHFASSLPDQLDKERVETLKLLNNDELIDLLENYPRPPKQFIRAIESEDVVTSEYLFRTTDGRELKPDDYILAFEKYVRDNPEHIEAISIILEKPTGWNTEALKELRTSLKSSSEGFTEDKLRKAYKYPLADIISMIKHAGKEEPILSAQERVDLALETVTKEKSLTLAQQEWLGLIRKHLIENLTIDAEDFDTMPIFVNKGGNFNRINQDFDNQLGVFISQLNTAMPQVYAYAN